MAEWRSLVVLLLSTGLFSITASIFRVSLSASWRLAVLEACAALGVLVWLTTELLSAIRAITFAGLVVTWGLVGAIAVIVACRLRPGSIRTAFATEYTSLRRGPKSLRGAPIVALAYMAAAVLILGIIAFAAAPNTWDSLTYHLSRVMHWQQNQSLGFYPTAIERQLSSGPWAEMAILQYQLLAATDRLANFVQFYALIGCMVGVSLIAESLGGDLDAQVFAGLATLAIPMGILQATSTQNDYVVALWCVCFAAFVLQGLKQEGRGTAVVFAGGALGLAILTKATAFLYLGPIGLWLAVELTRQAGVRAWPPILVLLGVAATILTPYMLRNFGLFGNPLGISSGPETGQYANRSHAPDAIASNVLRNLGMELASPLEGLNGAIETAIRQALASLGTDINDPRTTWQSTEYQVEYHVVFSTHEDSASNPLHLVVVVVASLGLIAYRLPKARIYMVCIAAGAIAFCFLLKWQPWANRLHLPFFVLAMPVAAVVMSNLLPGRKIYLPAFAVAVVGLPYLVANPSRPLIGADSVLLKDRLSQYFTNVPDHLQDYDEAARMISGAKCDQVGLVSPFDGREYLVWVFTRIYSPNTRVEHILVKNVSRRLKINFDPCAIVVLSPTQAGEMVYQDRMYVRSVATEGLNLYLAPGPSP